MQNSAFRKMRLPNTVLQRRIKRQLIRKRWMRKHFLRSDLWYINRRSVAAAALIGLFVAMIPLPLQMILAASAALAFNANMPIAVALVWLSNPVTVLPISWLSLCTGCWLLQKDIQNYEQLLFTSWQWDTLPTLLSSAWAPLLTGSIVMGLLLGLTGYYLTLQIWRVCTVYRWHNRKTLRSLN